MNVSAIMATQLITLSLDNTLGDAKAVFEQHNIHHILIIDEKKALVGLITDRDLYKHLSPAIGTAKERHSDLAQLKKRVNLIMTHTIISAPPTLTVKEALVWFDDNHISCLPVVDNGQLVGIVTWRDLIKVLAKIQRQQTNEQ